MSSFFVIIFLHFVCICKDIKNNSLLQNVNIMEENRNLVSPTEFELDVSYFCNGRQLVESPKSPLIEQKSKVIQRENLISRRSNVFIEQNEEEYVEYIKRLSNKYRKIMLDSFIPQKRFCSKKEL